MDEYDSWVDDPNAPIGIGLSDKCLLPWELEALFPDGAERPQWENLKRAIEERKNSS